MAPPMAAKEKEVSGQAVEAAIEELFKSYDLDESGELTRNEYLGIEMRLSFQEGKVFKGEAGTAKMTLADTDSSGTLDFDEFRTRIFTHYEEEGYSRAEIVKHLSEMVKMTLNERAKMGPRYHAGIRQVLRRTFTLFDVSGDGVLSPEEWIAAQKVVACEVNDEFDEGWIDENTFAVADTNGDGVLDVGEFLESSFSMFEVAKRRTDQILTTLQRCVKALEQERLKGKKETAPVKIFVQAAGKPEFQPPKESWQSGATEAEPDKNADAWKLACEIPLPLKIETAEDVAALVRMSLRKPADTWISVFYCGQPREAGAIRPVTLVRGERPGEGNAQSMIQYFNKPSAQLMLYVKNERKRPAKLVKERLVFQEEKEQILQKKTGQSWGLDWETLLVGDGQKLPPLPMVISVGDAVVVEVPISQLDEHGEYRYVTSIYMGGTDVLSKPVDEPVEVKKAKKKKSKSEAKLPDPLQQYIFVGLKEGKCVMFVDVSWEDQEEKLAKDKNLIVPVPGNSCARIGPIEVEVQKPPPPSKDSKGAAPAPAGGMQWWNGEKWSNKKGPAKRKKGKGKK